MDIGPIFRLAIKEALKDRFLRAAKEYFEYIGEDMINCYKKKLKEEERFYFFRGTYDDKGGVLTEDQQSHLGKLYRKLSLKYHPDRNPTGAPIFLQVHKYYEEGDIKALEQLLFGKLNKVETIFFPDGQEVPLTEDNVSGIIKGASFQAYSGGKDYCDPFYTKKDLIRRIKHEIDIQLIYLRGAYDREEEESILTEIEKYKSYIINPELCRHL